MNSLQFLFAFFLAASVHAVVPVATPEPTMEVTPMPTAIPVEELISPGSIFNTPEALLRARGLRQRVVNQGGCNVNVCYALDGSGSISSEDYRNEKDFVELVTAITGGTDGAAFAAVQYGLSNVAISDLTSNTNDFLLSVEDSILASAPRTFIAAGLGFCIQQLRPRVEDANKIVLFGDGRSNFGGNPVPIARRFRRTGGNICAVGIGFRNRRILRRIAGDRNRVLTIDDYFEFLDILDQIVVEVCGLSD